MSTAVLLEAVAPASAPAEAFLREVRSQGIRVPRLAEISDYLKDYPDVLTATRLACESAAAEFGASFDLSLELYVDPEIYDPHLMLYVRREPFDESVWEKLDRVRDAYADELADKIGWVHVGYDFRAPARR